MLITNSGDEIGDVWVKVTVQLKKRNAFDHFIPNYIISSCMHASSTFEFFGNATSLIGHMWAQGEERV